MPQAQSLIYQPRLCVPQAQSLIYQTPIPCGRQIKTHTAGALTLDDLHDQVTENTHRNSTCACNTCSKRQAYVKTERILVI